MKSALQEAIAYTIQTTVPNQQTDTEQDSEIKLITQESQQSNEDITEMDTEKEPRVRNVLPKIL